MPLLDQAERVFDQRQRGQPEEIHLEQRQLLEAVHIELRDNFIAVRFVERHQLPERLRRDHHARCVHRAVARKAFQTQRDLQHIIYARIFPRLGEARFLLDGVSQRNIQHVGDELGELVHVRVRYFEHAAHVFNRRARAERVEGDDLRHLLAAVFFGDVVDHFAAPVHAEIDVDIGQVDALRIEEAFEQQPILERIDIGDRHRVSDQAARRRAAPRPHRNALRAGVTDEVPDNQKIAGEFHRLDHPDFAVQALGVIRQVVLQYALGAHRFESRPALLEPLPGDIFEISVGGVLFGHVELGEWLLDLFERDVAALGDLPGAVDRVFELAEQLHHFVARFQIEVRRVPAHPVRVVHHFAGLDAQQDLVRARIVAPQVVRIVGDDQRKTGLLGKPVHLRG